MRITTTKKQLAALVAGGFMLWTVPAGAVPMELTLDESIKMALQNNPSIKVADEDKKIADWKVNEAKGNKLPSIDYAHTASRSQNYNDPLNRKDIFDNDVSITLPIYTGGQLEGIIKQAKLGSKAANLGVVKTRQQITLDATTAYFNILQAGNMVELSKESVGRLEAHLKNVKAQYEVGTVAKVDVLRSEVELANAEQSLIKAENSYELAIASLNNVVGLPLDTEINVKDNLKYTKYDQKLEDCIAYSLQKRPDIGQAQANVDSAKQGIGVARSGYMPTLAVVGGSDWYHGDYTGDDSWSVAMKASFNVFDSGVTKAKVRQADASYAKAKYQSKQVSDGVQLEVRQAYLNLREAEKRISTAQVAVEKAEEDFKIAQVRYTAGVGTNIDVMDAQVALTQAKTNYVQALYDYNTSQAKLNKAMGTPIKA